MTPPVETGLPRRMGRRRPRRAGKTPTLAAMSLAFFPFATGYYAPFLPHLAGLPAQSDAGDNVATAAVARIALATELMPFSREEAERLNNLRAADVAKVAAAQPFAVKDRFRGDPRFLSALDCLTQAIYYEADAEPDAGQRAIAQVVLNRVRHPGFPHSICAVVYQGAELPTGCQFTFTCDGSLARQPSRAGGARARSVALAALSGWVETPVGLSTHYHATYVIPYWASSLNKVTLIGSHIFYALRGPGGNAAAFHARYDFADEFMPALAAVPLPAMPPVDGAAGPRIEPMPVLSGGGSAAVGSTLEADRSGAIAAPAPQQQTLQADRQHGVLTVRGGDSALLAD
jgi:spore germination cell wall hydrolase CwlJ-like protein